MGHCRQMGSADGALTAFGVLYRSGTPDGECRWGTGGGRRELLIVIILSKVLPQCTLHKGLDRVAKLLPAVKSIFWFSSLTLVFLIQELKLR